jgi:hypothetical protein
VVAMPESPGDCHGGRDAQSTPTLHLELGSSAGKYKHRR